MNTHTLLSLSGKPILIIINNFTKQQKFDEAKKYLRDELGRVPVFAIRSTTLFDRVARDGWEWLENVHNLKGEYQLNKTRIKHEEVYDQIINYWENGNEAANT